MGRSEASAYGPAAPARTGTLPTASPPARATVDAPRLAPDVELLGEYKGSAYSQPPSLVRRRDGQVLQLSRLLYSVLTSVDGRRDLGRIAELVTLDVGRPVSADNVRYLVQEKLVPRGLVEAADAPVAVLERANPLLALRARGTLMPERVVSFVASVLRPLFLPPVVVAVVAGVVGLDYWLFAVHGLGGGVREVLRDPVSLLAVLGLTLVSAGFHECGHATACRYGGGRPGVIGFGVYLVWPSFFTNVTDSYRLTRAGRLRTDLGGLYFNLVAMLLFAAVYVVTGWEVLLLVVALTHLEMLQQLLPFVRFDGYFVLSDLVGVPDLFGRIGPILRSSVQRGRRDPRIAGLRRAARVVVTAWVLCVIPLLAVNIGYLLLYLPRIDGALWKAGRAEVHFVSVALHHTSYADAAVGGISILLLVLPAVGAVYMLTAIARQLVRASARWSRGRPGRQVLAAATGVACAAGVGFFWSSRGQLRDWGVGSVDWGRVRVLSALTLAAAALLLFLLVTARRALHRVDDVPPTASARAPDPVPPFAGTFGRAVR